jgi:signal transduction histidine kinase
VQVTVAMPFWGEHGELQWRYRLSGLAGAQGPIGDDGIVVLERLPSGDFDLEVEVAGTNGPRVVRVLHIEVVPPLYARWWAALLIAVVLTLVVVLLVRLRIRQLERNRRLLEAIVEERTDDLRRTNAALQREVQVKDRLVSILSHDIVSPLRFIAQVAGRSTRGPLGHDTEELRGVLQDIHSSSDKLYVNARNILSWIKHQDGRIAVVREEVDLHELVGAVLGQFQRADGVRITNAVAPGTIVRTDPRILSIILQNLVANAVVHAGGEVHVGSQALPEAWTLTVTDNGPGMSAKARALFEERLHVETSRHGEHATTDRPGLGHVIVADLLRLLDGSLRLGTPPGGGTAIEVRLPGGTKEAEG